jgi:hypothetical protein
MPVNFKDIASGKVKLEFGNAEQIEAIDKEQEKKEKGAYWRVDLSINGSTFIVVQAKDEEEAEALARERLDISDFDPDIDISVDSVEEVEVESESDGAAEDGQAGLADSGDADDASEG